jgi:hypothetical protein
VLRNTEVLMGRVVGRPPRLNEEEGGRVGEKIFIIAGPCHAIRTGTRVLLRRTHICLPFPLLLSAASQAIAVADNLTYAGNDALVLSRNHS